MENLRIGRSMLSSHEKQTASTESAFQMGQPSKLPGNTRYALISGPIPPSFDGWMTSEQARAWLLSDAMPPTRRHKVLMRCPVCASLFTKAPSKLRAQQMACEKLTHSCSNKCMGHMRTSMMTVPLSCDECGKDFTVSRSEHSRRLERGDSSHFCSNACYGKHRSRVFVGERHHNYNRVELTCTQCGKGFLRTQGEARQYRTMKPFCTKTCYTTWLRGRPTQKDTGRGSLRSYPPEFKALRKQMLVEGALCAVCMFPAKDLHHRDEDVENNSPENLIPVCRSCHKRHHVGPPHPLLSPLKR